MNKKTVEFFYGMCFGILVGFIIYAYTLTPLGASSYQRGEVSWKPLYVTIVEE